MWANIKNKYSFCKDSEEKVPLAILRCAAVLSPFREDVKKFNSEIFIEGEYYKNIVEIIEITILIKYFH